MKDRQKQLILDLSSDKVDQARFLSAYGIAESEVPEAVATALRDASAQHDADVVEYAMLLGFRFSMPDDFLSLIHDLVVQDWHTQHENMIGLIQKKADVQSIPVLQKVILLKPTLKYLDYDDYGSFYKKCLWALQAIGTPEAIAVITECTASKDAALKEQAEYRLSKIEKEQTS